MSWRILEGDCREVLRVLPAQSVHTAVTSPPYFGLRDYGHDGQIGLELTPDEFVAAIVAVFREVWRVLRDDGTVWLNLGDSYAASQSSDSRTSEQRASSSTLGPKRDGLGGDNAGHKAVSFTPRSRLHGVKPKDLIGIPWAVAQALRAPYYTGTIRDERDRIWLAAMIDAEGCMFIHKRKIGQSNGQGYSRKNASFGAGLEISSTDRVIVERCVQITGLGSICEQSPEQNARRKQTIYRWSLRSNVCRDVVREVYPYLVAKQHEARLLCGCPSSGPTAEEAWLTLKAIHQGGEHGDLDFPAPESMFEPGWYLRSEIIWAKKNCMPESVTDRPTKAHEQLFLLSKSPRYFYDADAVREEDSGQDHARAVLEGQASLEPSNGLAGPHQGIRTLEGCNGAGRNKRSVWTVATQPYAGAHFATFPPKLIEPCILAGCPERCCSGCGAPWVRPKRAEWQATDDHARTQVGTMLEPTSSRTVGFEPSCDCDADAVPGTVLDPFAGAGTTGMVALRHNRSFVGIELNAAYADLARRRICDDAPLFNTASELVA